MRQLTLKTTAMQSPLLLLIRAYWGWQFIETGWGKLHNLEKVGSYFGSLGLPLPALTAQFIGLLELCGGILLVLGLGARLIALALSVNMLVAYFVADREALFAVLTNPDQFYAAAPYTFLFASLLVLVFGPGKFAVDRWLPPCQGDAALPY